jgi:hypothetical protein
MSTAADDPEGNRQWLNRWSILDRDRCAGLASPTS